MNKELTSEIFDEIRVLCDSHKLSPKESMTILSGVLKWHIYLHDEKSIQKILDSTFKYLSKEPK